MSNLAFIHQKTSEVKQNDPHPPPYGAIDLNKFDRMWINPRNMLKADWLRDAPGDVVRAKLMLTLTAFHEIPAGSVEDRDRVLAHQLWIDLDQWLAIKPAVFDDWEYCSDGRWYVTGEMREQILESDVNQKRYAERAKLAREAKKRKEDQEAMKMYGQATNAFKDSPEPSPKPSPNASVNPSSGAKVEEKRRYDTRPEDYITDDDGNKSLNKNPAGDSNPF